MTPQRGWVGLLALLVAVALIALLAGSVLRGYGLAGGGGRASHDATKGDTAAEAAAGAPRAAEPSPRDALKRAHELQDAVNRQAEDYEKRIDAQSK